MYKTCPGCGKQTLPLDKVALTCPDCNPDHWDRISLIQGIDKDIFSKRVELSRLCKIRETIASADREYERQRSADAEAKKRKIINEAF